MGLRGLGGVLLRIVVARGPVLAAARFGLEVAVGQALALGRRGDRLVSLRAGGRLLRLVVRTALDRVALPVANLADRSMLLRHAVDRDHQSARGNVWRGRPGKKLATPPFCE